MSDDEFPEPIVNINSWMVAWTPRGWDHDVIGRRPPNRSNIEVGPWPDESGWTRRYAQAMGCNFGGWGELSLDQQVASMMLWQLRCIEDGINPQAAHREFLKIAEYQEYVRNHPG